MEEYGLDKNDQRELNESMPLDYSFKKMTSLLDLKSDKPRGGRVGKAPTRGKSKKFLTRSIWLSNNGLANTDGLDQFVRCMLEIPEALGWIDLSFNEIKEVDEALLDFPNLTIVYYHGNQIENLDTVIKLSKLRKLKRLTLHGNPVAKEPGYRSYVVHLLPQLSNLDFAPVLNAEKLAPVPAGSNKRFPELFQF